MTHDPRINALVEAARAGRLSRRDVLRRGAALGLGAAALAALPGVGGRRTAAQEKTQVRLATWAHQEEGAELQAILDRINGESTTFEIVHEPTPGDPYYTKVQTTLAGGTGADLFWMGSERVAGYASRGALLDIGDRLAADQSPAADLEDYFPAVLPSAQYEGKTYGLPWISQPVMLYYNPALFEAAGVAPPDESWTWETFKEAAAALTDPAQGVYGTSFNGWPPVQMFIWQAGGDVISEDLASCPIDTPEAIAGAQFYQDIVFNEEYAPSEATIKEQGFAEMVKAGKVAMFFGGASDDLDYASKKDPKNAVIKIALVPKGPQSRTTFAYTAVTAVNAATENADAAYAALVALTDGIHHWKVGAPRQSLANPETITASVPDKAESAPIIVQALPEMRPLRVIPDQQEWDDTFLEVFAEPLYNRDGSPEELAEEARPELEALLPN